MMEWENDIICVSLHLMNLLQKLTAEDAESAEIFINVALRTLQSLG